MYVDEVVSMFKTLVDEPDETFESAADVAVLARTAHEEMRSLTADVQPKMILVRQNFVVNNASFYDFADVANATVLLGAGPLAPAGARRIHTVHEVRQLDDAGKPSVIWRGTNDESQLWRYDTGYSPAYYLEGSVLRFGSDVTATFELLYVPVVVVDWTKQASGDNEFIDDFSHFHDLIALKMAEQYMIRDGEINGPLRERIAKRELAFDLFLQSGRDKGPGGNTLIGPRNFWE